ncbi:MAG TPA: hypothetical protein VFB80_12495 [Pirellulaceae bacterium]|nr:hypothetical protein [Pirellulaceae bacterium]
MSTQPQISPLAVFNGSFLGLIALIIGFATSFIAGHELLTSLRCGASPSPASVAELAQHGPTAGDYVRLNDFEVEWQGYIYWPGEDGRWTFCDVPLRVAGSAAPPRVLARVYGAANDAELRRLMAGSELTGIVSGHGIRGEGAAALASYNPGMDPGACWIVSINRHPADSRLLGGIFAAGVGIFTLSMFLFVYCRPRATPEQAVLKMMSPLLIMVEGLHALSDWLPAGSRRICGAVLFAPGAALAAWGGYGLWQAARASAAEVGAGPEILAILALDFGVALALVALSFVFVEPKGEAPASAVYPQASAGAGA